MLERNITYKRLSRIQLFGEDGMFDGTQHQYDTTGSTIVNNSSRMRFDSKGALSNVILARNARAIVETACIPSIANMNGKTVIVRLASSTQDRVFDTKKFLAGNPILFCMAASSTVDSLSTLYNGTDFFL